MKTLPVLLALALVALTMATDSDNVDKRSLFKKKQHHGGYNRFSARYGPGYHHGSNFYGPIRQYPYQYGHYQPYYHRYRPYRYYYGSRFHKRSTDESEADGPVKRGISFSLGIGSPFRHRYYGYGPYSSSYGYSYNSYPPLYGAYYPYRLGHRHHFFKRSTDEVETDAEASVETTEEAREGKTLDLLFGAKSFSSSPSYYRSYSYSPYVSSYPRTYYYDSYPTTYYSSDYYPTTFTSDSYPTTYYAEDLTSHDVFKRSTDEVETEAEASVETTEDAREGKTLDSLFGAKSFSSSPSYYRSYSYSPYVSSYPRTYYYDAYPTTYYSSDYYPTTYSSDYYTNRFIFKRSTDEAPVSDSQVRAKRTFGSLFPTTYYSSGYRTYSPYTTYYSTYPYSYSTYTSAYNYDTNTDTSFVPSFSSSEVSTAPFPNAARNSEEKTEDDYNDYDYETGLDLVDDFRKKRSTSEAVRAKRTFGSLFPTTYYSSGYRTYNPYTTYYGSYPYPYSTYTSADSYDPSFDPSFSSSEVSTAPFPNAARNSEEKTEDDYDDYDYDSGLDLVDDFRKKRSADEEASEARTLRSSSSDSLYYQRSQGDPNARVLSPGASGNYFYSSRGVMFFDPPKRFPFYMNDYRGFSPNTPYVQVSYPHYAAGFDYDKHRYKRSLFTIPDHLRNYDNLSALRQAYRSQQQQTTGEYKPRSITYYTGYYYPKDNARFHPKITVALNKRSVDDQQRQKRTVFNPYDWPAHFHSAPGANFPTAYITYYPRYSYDPSPSTPLPLYKQKKPDTSI